MKILKNFVFFKDIFYLLKGIFFLIIHKKNRNLSRQVEVILFDFDDTIFPTYELRQYIKKFYRGNFKGSMVDVFKIFQKIDSNYFKNKLKKLIDMLQFLSQHYKLGIISDNSISFITKFLQELKIEKYFSFFFTPEKIKVYKSSPIFFLRIISLLHSKNIIIVGNNPFKDVLYPKIFGIRTILLVSRVPYKYKLIRLYKLIKPDFIIDDLDSFLYDKFFKNVFF